MNLRFRKFPFAVSCPFCGTCLYAINPDMDYFQMRLCSHVAFIDDEFFDEMKGDASVETHDVYVSSGGNTQATIGFKLSAVPPKWKPKKSDFK